VAIHRDTEYALICLTHMAKEDKVYSARTLAGSCRIPYELLCKVLQRLARVGLIESVRGPRGGYRFIRNPQDIPVSEVVEAMHAKQRIVPCIDGGECERSEICSVRGGVMRIQSMWDELVGSITLAEFIADKTPSPEGV